MGLKVDTKRRRLALGLGLTAIVSILCAWLVRSPESRGTCVHPNAREASIRSCVADRARNLEPGPLDGMLLVLGASALLGSVLAAARSTKRVISLAEAAELLGSSPGRIRALVDAGEIRVAHKEAGALFVDPEDVRRLAEHTPKGPRLAPRVS